MSSKRPDAFGTMAYVVYIMVGGLLVFGFAWSLEGAVQTQAQSVCRALSPEVRSRVQGVVLDASGSAVPQAKVFVGEQGRAEAPAAVTDEEGRFAVFMPDGEQALHVESGEADFSGTILLDGASDVDVQVKLPASGLGGELVEQSRDVLMAPEIELQDLNGDPINLSDYRGKFVIVNFWATWCEPCITEWPQLDQLAKRLGDRGDVVILAVSQDNKLEDIKPFLEQMSLLDTEVGVVWDPSQAVHKAYGTAMIPDTYFVDEQGRLVNAYVNVRKWGAPEAFHCVDGSVGKS